MNPVKTAKDVRSPELLAPAGGAEAGYAALHYGADAIYLGLPRFSARAEASNFSLEELSDITSYAHSLKPRRRVYVTVNTLVLQRELDELVDVLAGVAELGVDAVILQDWGAFAIVRRHFPELRIHASTQMAIHNRPGVEMASELGFSRVTLARELTLEELVDIAAVPRIEKEIFIHGALCYSYSGLCLFSSHVMGRSGNRGRCAYLCRDSYRDESEQRFVFSMKDLALPECLPDLRRIGVAALKIEGRMKSPIYVAATVKYYRALLDGSASPCEADDMARDIKTIFSRPWTDLYLRSRRNRKVVEPDCVGHRGILIGKVQSIIPGRAGEDRMRFKSSRPIEAHDGLQIDVPGLSRPYGFAVSNLRVRDGESFIPVFEAPAGALVEVALPLEHPVFSPGTPIACSSSQALKQRYRVEKPNPGRLSGGRAIDFAIQIQSDAIRAEGDCPIAGRIHAEVELSGTFQPARDAAKMGDAIEQAFSKLGGTRFAPGRITISNPDSLFVPVSLLNSARRELVDQLEAKWQAFWQERRASVKDGLKTTVFPGGGDPSKDAGPDSAKFLWCLKTDSPACLDEFEEADWLDTEEVIIEMPEVVGASFVADLDRLGGIAGRERVRLALPVILRGWELEEAWKNIRALVGAGWRRWQTSNQGAWKMLRSAGLESGDISVDWPLYAINRVAGRQMLDLGASSFTLSPEDELENLRSMLADFGDRAALIVYQDTPLMISEACVMPEAGCDRKGGCGVGDLLLASSFGEKITVKRRGCRMIVVNERPFSLGGRIADLAVSGVTRLRADFLYGNYTPVRTLDVWRRLRMGEVVPGTHSGNFDRGLA